jgi:mRNA-degrading endonuclease RelE of RelBE toxin-antitoxin system
LAYQIEYEPDAQEDIRWFPRRQQVLILAEVKRLLGEQPALRSNKRQPMRPNPFLAAWELRIGDLRVYYDVVEEPEQRVRILRAGEKVRERVRIRGEYVSITL